jgi:hypothetical protein
MLSVLHVVSFPKSGRTWLRVMLDDIGVDAVYTHDGSAYEERLPTTALNPDKTEYAVGPVLFMVRDPRDVVVSGYFQVVRRLQLEAVASMSNFIRDPRYGFEKIVHFNLQWFAAAPRIPRLAIVSYEDLHKDPGRTLAAVAQFAGHVVPAETVEDIVSSRSFAHMRRLEASGGFTARYGSALTPMNHADPETYKVRRGIVGGYIDYLSEADIAYCDHILSNAKYGARLHEAMRVRSVLQRDHVATIKTYPVRPLLEEDAKSSRE